MHFQPSVIAVFAAMLTVTIAAPTSGSEIKEKRVAAPGDPGKDYVYPFKTYPEEEKRSDPAKDYVYPFKTYPGEEKRSDPAKDYIYPFKTYPEDEKRAAAQEFEEGK
ncbi:hypothetical protein HO133_005765 [Letharia lupina]|uniref:Uncharacterized protein n=1 Tax=Letharia lupina TaxID=560253 RepID=A0A8H6C7K1_9LECA|nr:uncharacterized protein HO133_005765 [Letharia lupina]KAF6218417.1 hypothetical protein HO133_005765 [Letharia lupina]